MGVRAGMVGMVRCRDGEAYSMDGTSQRLEEREEGRAGVNSLGP